MVEIYETKNFKVVTPFEPHITREDGGHIMIIPKKDYCDRTQLPPKKAIELMRLTMITGEAFAKAMNKNGVDIGRINYQDNGNWSVFKPGGPILHIHIVGRAKSAKIQKYGTCLKLPDPKDDPNYYKNNKQLTNEDVKEINKQIRIISRYEKYKNSNWKLL